MVGVMNLLGHGIILQASLAEGHLQQVVGSFTVSYLVTASRVLQEMKYLMPTSTLLSIKNLDDLSYLEFSDASNGSYHTPMRMQD